MKKNGAKVIDEYSKKAAQLSEKAKEEELEKCIRYNESLLKDYTVITEPFDPNTFPVTDGVYSELLAQNDIMAVVRIPCIDVNLPVYHGTDSETLMKGAGHLQNTSLPIGGEGSHAVISAHTGMMQAKFFSDLDKVRIGDYAFIDVLGDTLAYEVYKTEVVLPNEVSSLYPVAGKDLLTLVTCTPYGVNSHRLLVHCKRVPFDKAQSVEKIDTRNNWEKRLLICAFILSIIFIVLVIYIIKRQIKAQKNESKKIR